MPTLSACVACRNAAPHLSQCLSSLAGHFDQVLFLDDGSTDNSAAIAATYDFVEVLTPRGFNGQGAAKAQLVAHTTGDYIALIDADDYLLTNPRLSERLAPLEQSDRVELTLAPVQNLHNREVLRPFGDAWTVAVRHNFQAGGMLWRGATARALVAELVPRPFVFELQLLQALLKRELRRCRDTNAPATGDGLIEHIGGDPVAAYRADWSEAQASRYSRATRLELLDELWAAMPLSIKSPSLEFFYEQRYADLSKVVS